MQVGFRYIKSLALCILFAASAYGQEFCPQELLYGLPVLIRTTAEVDALNSVSRLRERSQHTIRIEDKWEATLNSQWTQSAQIQLRLLKKLSAQSFRDHERLNTYLRQLEKVQPLTETIQDRIRWVTAQIQRVRRERDDFNRDGAFLERRLNFIASQSNGGIGSKIENELQLLDLERFAQIAGLNSRSDLFGEERELKEGNLNRAQIYRRMALLDGKASVDAIHRAIKFRIAHQLPLPGKDAIPQQFLASQDDLRKVANLNRNLSLESLIPRDDVPAQFLKLLLPKCKI
jgi:hypothetical protein